MFSETSNNLLPSESNPVELLQIAINGRESPNRRIKAFNALGKTLDTNANQQIAFWTLLGSDSFELRFFCYSAIITATKNSKEALLIGTCKDLRAAAIRLAAQEQDNRLQHTAYLVRAFLGDPSIAEDIRHEIEAIENSSIPRLRTLLERVAEMSRSAPSRCMDDHETDGI